MAIDTVEDRFRAKVDRRGPDECWPWLAGRTTSGYGVFVGPGGRLVYAHRFALVLAGVDLESDEMALHSCDNPPCVNWRHLSPGDAARNAREAYDRGLTPPPPIRYGEDHHAAKLTSVAVREARERHARGESLRSLARTFGVGRKTITHAVRGVTWAAA